MYFFIYQIYVYYTYYMELNFDSFFGDSVIQLQLFSFLGNYFMQGSCQKADSCVFAHGPHELRTPGAWGSICSGASWQQWHEIDLRDNSELGGQDGVI